MATSDDSTLSLFADESTWSPVVLPAKPPASPESGSGTKTTDGSGANTSASSETSGPSGSWQKTFRDSLVSVLSGWTGFSTSWRQRVTPAKRSLWVLKTSARPTSGSESGSWPTPQTVDGKAARPLRKKVDRQTRGETPGSYRGDLADYAGVNWPTPSATPYGSSNNGCPGDGREEYATKGKPSLAGAAKWTTPCARDEHSPLKLTRGAGSAAKGNDFVTPLGIQVTQEKRWGTPRVTTNGGAGKDRGDNRARLEDQVHARWQTPRAEDAESSGMRVARGVADTLTAATRWPTPQAADGERASEYISRREDNPTLLGAVRWPTPTAGDAASAGNRNLEGSAAHDGTSLTDAVAGGQAPRAGRRAASSGSTNGSRRASSRNRKPPSDGSGSAKTSSASSKTDLS